MELRSGERLDDLGHTGLQLIQSPAWAPFALDSVLLSHFVQLRPGERLLDLGTGTGVIVLLLAARYADAELHGLELQAELADMARRSVDHNALAARVHICQGDWGQAATLYGNGRFSVVTINPPYHRPGTGRLSPVAQRARAHHALDGSLDAAMAAAATGLRHGGRCYVVFVTERLTELLLAMRAHQLEPKLLRPVHSFAHSPAKLVLIRADKGGGPGLRLQPPLVIYSQPGVYAAEVAAYFEP